jgi:hypothetical protein
MMKQRQYLLVWLLALATLALHAQQQYVGYTQSDSITFRGAAFGEAGTYPIGALLSPKMLSPYVGCQVLGIRVAVSQNMGRARTFIYSVAGGTLTAEVEQKQKLYEGWNAVYFNGDGYVIKGTETLFFGFDYTETAEMVAADEGALCGYGEDVEGGCYTYYDFGNGPRLYSLSGVGCLCVQLIVDVSSLPAYDLNLISADRGFKYKKAGEEIDVMVTFMNAGRETVRDYQFGCQLDEEEPVLFPQEDSIKAGRTQVSVFTYQLPETMTVGTHQLSVFVCGSNGAPLTDEALKDTLHLSFAIYENSMQRNCVYMEVYSDQTSPYVPYLDEALKQLVDNSSILSVVNVHKPGTSLSIGTSDYLHDLYAYDWPTFTVNRSYFPGEAYVAYDMNDYLPVIGADMTAAIIGDLVDQDYYSPTFASLGLQLDYNMATRKLTVKGSGDLLPEAEAIYGKLALTLMLTEDGVKATQAEYNERTGRTSNNANYLHNQVLRAYLTSPVGDALSVSDLHFEAVYDITLPEKWNAEKISVVGLLTGYVDVQGTERSLLVAQLSDQLLELDVVNATQMTIPQAMGISSVGQSSRQAPARYSLDGKRMRDRQERGLYIERLQDGTVRKVAVR